MKHLSHLPFYPPLFAIFPVLALYAHNMGELTLSELWMPLGAAFGLALVILLTAQALLNNWIKTGIITILFIVPFFHYGYAKDLLGGLGWLVLIIWAIVYTITAFFILRTHRSLRSPTIALNLTAVITVAFLVVSIGVYEFGRPAWETPEAPLAAGNSSCDKPDIYYIILDMYPRADVLEEYYNFDNSEFIDYLESKRLYVPTNNLINHIPSSHSMASALNMGYLNYMADELKGETDMNPIYSLLQNHRAWQFLKPLGYRYVHMGSYWEMNRVNEYAHINLSPAEISEFPLLVFNTTVLSDILGVLALDPRERHADYALEQFDRLTAIENTGEPLFVFAHIVIPHGPYVFDQGGNYIDQEYRSVRDQIIDQLVFCNKKIIELVDSILAKDESAVIILQGDHGAGCEGVPDCEAWKGTGEPSELFTKLILRNFTALRLPTGNEMLYDTITPVNTFRIIFNSYFGAEYEMLEGRQYLSSYSSPYQFIDVTNQEDGME